MQPQMYWGYTLICVGFLQFVPWSWWVRSLDFFGSFLDPDGFDPWDFFDSWVWPLGFLWFMGTTLGFFDSWVRPLGFPWSWWVRPLGFLWFIPWSWWVRSLRIQDQGTSPLLRRQERSNKSNFWTPIFILNECDAWTRQETRILLLSYIL